MTAALLAGCGSGKSGGSKGESAPDIKGLEFAEEEDVEYATHFKIFKYKDGYSLISIKDTGDKFLVVPKDGEVPDELPENTQVLQQPVKNIYLAATATMAMFTSMDALDTVRMSSIQADGWSVPEAKKAMKQGVRPGLPVSTTSLISS